MYKNRKYVQSELKLMTVAVAAVKDNLHGQRTILGDSSTSGIAAEICELRLIRVLDVDLYDVDAVDGDCDLVCLSHCNPLACLDLAAARAMRASRGKCACLCACRGKSQLQAYPGDGSIPPIPDGDDETTWHAAVSILREHCAYGSDVMSFESLRTAAHVPPEDHDFDAGPWRCCFCDDIIIWSSREEFDAERARVAALEVAAADNDEEKKVLDKLLMKHAETHMDAIYLQAPVVKTGTDFYIVDPMHCLELNLAKTAWKYSIGDRMLDHHRERVAAYLSKIKCPLDIRNKGTRSPENKWFSAAIVDKFVSGNDGENPGLAGNIYAICERVFDDMLPVAQKYAAAGATDGDGEPEAAPPTAAPAATAIASIRGRGRRKRTAPSTGFVRAADTAAAADDAERGREEGEFATQLASWLDLDGLGCNAHSNGGGAMDHGSEQVRTFVRARFGNHAREVLDCMRLWEAYFELHSAWREEWTDDSGDYRARRALRFLRAGVGFLIALNKVSDYKQKSTYAHLAVFVVAQQLYKHGNTWCYSTAAIESRGARLKRQGRSTVSWRPAVDGWTSYDYVDSRTGEHVKRQQRYSSSAVQQLMMQVCAAEDAWHKNEAFATPAKLRLQQQLRTRRLKCDLPDGVNVSRESALAVLSKAAAHESCSLDASAPATVTAAAALHQLSSSFVHGKPVFGPKMVAAPRRKAKA
eukprot:4345318-Pleurochrysis_carterae.AAC.3